MAGYACDPNVGILNGLVSCFAHHRLRKGRAGDQLSPHLYMKKSVPGAFALSSSFPSFILSLQQRKNDCLLWSLGC